MKDENSSGVKADEDLTAFIGEREDWIHFLNEVIGPFALASALSAATIEARDKVGFAYILIILAMTFYRTSRYKSAYFRTASKIRKSISESYNEESIRRMFFPLKIIPRLWFYCIGFISLVVVAFVGEESFEVAKDIGDRAFWMTIFVMFMAAFLASICGSLNKRRELKSVTETAKRRKC